MSEQMQARKQAFASLIANSTQGLPVKGFSGSPTIHPTRKRNTQTETKHVINSKRK